MKNLLLISLFVSVSLFSQNPKSNYNLSDKGVALEGYDPMSYFLSTPKKGNTSLSYKEDGVIYFFSTQKNLDLFKKAPSQFKPAYGGWCAYAMGAKGTKVEVDPENYKIINGRLYLFYKSLFSNTLDDWNKDETNLLNKANVNWSKINK